VTLLFTHLLEMAHALSAGSQAQAGEARLETVEGVLEQAMLDAGAILPTNYGNQRRLKWTRSSRTDRGVHSLCTVRTPS
jgi:tRNA pseudouridine38-40 synthase